MGRRVLSIETQMTGKAGPEIRALAALVTKSLEENRKATERVAQAQEKANKRAEKWFNLNEIGVQMTRRVGDTLVNLARNSIAALNEALTNAIGKSTEFREAMAEVSTLVDGGFDMESVTNAAIRLSGAYGSQATSQAKAFYQGISAGATSAGESIALMDAANRLAVGGVTNVESAIGGLTAVVNGYGLTFQDTGAISELFFRTMQKGVTTVGELAGQIGLVVPTANAAGVNLDEMFGAIAAITKAGIKTENTITFLNQAITSVLNPSKQAADEAERLGIEFNVAALRAKGLEKFLREITTSAKYNDRSMTQLFGNVRALRAVLALTANNGKQYSEVMKYMRSDADAAGDAFKRMADTVAFKKRQFDSLRESVAITFGDIIGNSEAVKGGIDGLNQSTALLLENMISSGGEIKITKEEMTKLARDGSATVVDAFGDLVDVGADVILNFEGITSGVRKSYDTLKSVYEVLTWLNPVSLMNKLNMEVLGRVWDAFGEDVSYVDPKVKSLSDTLRLSAATAKKTAQDIRDGKNANDQLGQSSEDTAKKIRGEVSALLAKVKAQQKASAAKKAPGETDEERERKYQAHLVRLQGYRLAHEKAIAALMKGHRDAELQLDKEQSAQKELLDKGRERAEKKVGDAQKRIATSAARFLSGELLGAFEDVLSGARTFEQAMGDIAKRIGLRFVEHVVVGGLAKIFGTLVGALGIGAVAGSFGGGLFAGMLGGLNRGGEVPEPQRFGSGGIPRGGVAGVDSVLSWLTPNEVVVPVGLADAPLRDVLMGRANGSGGGGGATINIHLGLSTNGPLPSAAQFDAWMRTEALPSLVRLRDNGELKLALGIS